MGWLKVGIAALTFGGAALGAFSPLYIPLFSGPELINVCTIADSTQSGNPKSLTEYGNGIDSSKRVCKVSQVLSPSTTVFSYE
ncbi:hypothetical protein MHLP_00770 [Candidatus Mycoplasma haematolamae str. Purdue]|uniref:Uncharacterized protein n=1 Tax=Mycoplasma haematolamae (strain Purdue) TaxID=1212765 RepID=I7CIN2_MYCHA|nr:hypothetical protein [Candidatus Mycoplasma haematolamae]AFO51734.1 hypothetical protein MHLP_00770 [Candidatus Mycoplasma haematolamae str. Purdue]